MLEDYLSNKAVYHELEVHFLNLSETEMAKCGAKKEASRHPHYNNCCTDDTHLMNANPIFSDKALVTGDILRISIYEEIAEYTVMHKTRGDNDELK
ncbi:hypothetical protein P5705_09940 [Pseudomonas entomophila]|uniref:hypothetical protein n=1 Tax=Pseudomonas entomophila TaxID=312306 RepID=UPI0024050736|nr:hypothetical protein [Pseudomonas entomophila]MDF9617963.1 hypothetical protein [Pseudomonas entomophila]